MSKVKRNIIVTKKISPLHWFQHEAVNLAD